jgi:uridine phosphorylase
MILNEEGVISPRKTRRDPRLGLDAIMIMVRSELKRITRKVSARRVSFSGGNLYDLFEAVSPSGRPVAIAGPFFGAPQAVMGLEKLIALGAGRIWILGWCGSLVPGLSIGDIIVPSAAFCEEGTSRLYTGGMIEPVADSSLLGELEVFLEAGGVHATKGAVWTTDAVYRETPSKIRAYRRLGALAVEMELSALMSVAIFRSVALAALLVISDELTPAGWRPGFSDSRLAKGCEIAGSALMSLAAGAGIKDTGGN